MNIGMILPGSDFPPDIRVEKEARALQKNNHKLFILCDLKDSSRPLVEDWEGMHIIRRKRIPVSTLIEKFNGIPGWNWFLCWQWRAHIDKVVQEKGIDVLHIHDLPKASAVIAIGKKRGLPVIIDFHENYPASLKSYVEGWTGGMRLAARTLINVRKWEEYEIEQALRADEIIVVVDEARERLARCNVPSDRITVIENTEDVKSFGNIMLDQSILQQYQSKFIILYIGGFGGRGDHRGLTTVIQAMPSIIRSIPNAHLLLVGKGSIKPILANMITQYSLDNHVTLIDWVPFDKVPSYIAASSICLVPHNSNPHTEATSPHKLFQYMIFGKPMVVSSCRPLKRVVEQIGSGYIFQAGDAEDLSRTVVQLKDEKVRGELGEKGRAAVLSEYNWAHTSQALVKLYDNLKKGDWNNKSHKHNGRL